MIFIWLDLNRYWFLPWYSTVKNIFVQL